MSSKRKFFFVFIFIVLDIFLLIGFLTIRDITMENRLRHEMSVLSELDMTQDRYSLKIRTNGEYAIVEKAIKGYLDSTAVLLQDTLKVVKDEKLLHILSYQNYVEDGKEFQQSLSYLESMKKDFNHNMDDLFLKLDSKTIQKYIRSKTKDQGLWNLYEELILSDTMRGDFQEISDLLGKTQERMNGIFDTSHDVLLFLMENQDSWVLEDGEIKFQTDALYQQYMGYIMKLNS